MQQISIPDTGSYFITADLRLEASDRDFVTFDLHSNDNPSSRVTERFYVETDSWTRYSTLIELKKGDYQMVFNGPMAGTDFTLDTVAINREFQAWQNSIAFFAGRAKYGELGCSGCHGLVDSEETIPYPLDLNRLSFTSRTELPVYLHESVPHDSPEKCRNQCAVNLAKFLYESLKQ